MEPYYVIVQLLGQTVAIELRDARRDSDVWDDLYAFDVREGTYLYDLIDRRNLLDIAVTPNFTMYSVTRIIRTARDFKSLMEA